jgi:hypothetical protein
MFGRYTNATTEDGFITIKAVNLRTIQFKPLRIELHIAPETVTFTDEYIGIKMKRSLIGIFDIVE